jgi:hypothetical protein
MTVPPVHFDSRLPLAPVPQPSYTALMSEIPDPPPAAEPPDPRIDLLRRALELSGVEPLVAGALAGEHYGRITMRGRQFEVTDVEGSPYLTPEAGEDPILHLAERIKESIPTKFLTKE